MSAENVNFVKSMYEALARGEVPAVIGMMSPDLCWTPAEHSPYDQGRVFKGPDDIVHNVLVPVATEWEGFRIKTERFLDAGDTVVMEGRFSGTYKATGRTTNAQVVQIWEVRDGKLAAFRQYTDTAELREVLGKTVGSPVSK